MTSRDVRGRTPTCQQGKIKFASVRRSPEVPENKGYRHLSGPTESVANDLERSQWQPTWQPENDLEVHGLGRTLPPSTPARGVTT
jgi:hypothetical protein